VTDAPKTAASARSADLEAIVSDEVLSDDKTWKLLGLQVADGHRAVADRHRAGRPQGRVIEESAIGDGMVDAACAACAAIAKATAVSSRA
jgi:hypothetical protein